jgi:hypothetical protein
VNVESIILALSAGSTVPALATAVKAWLQGRKNTARVTITVRDKNDEKVNIELNPENAEQAEEIIQKFLDQYPPEKREADK